MKMNIKRGDTMNLKNYVKYVLRGEIPTNLKEFLECQREHNVIECDKHCKRYPCGYFEGFNEVI